MEDEPSNERISPFTLAQRLVDTSRLNCTYRGSPAYLDRDFRARTTPVESMRMERGTRLYPLASFPQGGSVTGLAM